MPSNRFKGLGKEFLKNITKHSDEELTNLYKETKDFNKKATKGFGDAVYYSRKERERIDEITKQVPDYQYPLGNNMMRRKISRDTGIPIDDIKRYPKATRKQNLAAHKERTIRNKYPTLIDTDPVEDLLWRKLRTDDDRNSLYETGAMYTKVGAGNTPSTFNEFSNQIRKARAMQKAYRVEIGRRKLKID